MTGTDQVTARSQDGAEDPRDERAAELVLAKLAEARVLLAMRPAAKVTTIVAAVVLAIAGVWLRGQVRPGWPVIAIACVLLAALGWVIPALSGLGRREPEWVKAARVHERSLDSWVPATALQIARQCLTRLRQGGHEAHLYVSRCTSTDPAHFAVCQTAGVFPVNGRVLVVLGEHLTAWPAATIGAVLGHESRYLSRWRMPISYAIEASAIGGWVILGWAVPWPTLLPAAAAFQAMLTVLFWVIEASCDLGAARSAGAGPVLDALTRTSQVAAAAGAALPAWQRYAASALAWITGTAHPPFAVRRAVVRTLLPHLQRITS